MFPLDYSQALERFLKSYFTSTLKTHCKVTVFMSLVCVFCPTRWLDRFLDPQSSGLFLLLLFVFKEASLLLLRFLTQQEVGVAGLLHF